MTTKFDDERAVFSQITRVARQIMDRLAPLRRSKGDIIKNPFDNRQRIISFTLPHPQSITPKLFNIGLSITAAKRLSELYVQYALQLRLENERAAYSTLHACLEARNSADTQREQYAIQAAFAARYERVLSDWTDRILARARRCVEDAQKMQDAAHPDKVPLKRKRSHSVEMDVASACDHNESVIPRKRKLNPTQVDRSFGGKNYQPKRCRNVATVSESLYSSHAAQRHFDCCTDTALSDVASERNMPAKRGTGFATNVPCYAFPTKYRDGCKLLVRKHTLPVRFNTPWPFEARKVSKPAGTAITRDAMEDLARCFAALHIGVESSKGKPKQIAKLKNRLSPIAAQVGYPGLAAVMPKAPLSALVRGAARIEVPNRSAPNGVSRAQGACKLDATEKRKPQEVRNILPKRVRTMRNSTDQRGPLYPSPITFSVIAQH
ncbi:hypothetical protein NM688_g21 [Phlebia brevispora]|uniref:Uncharacterized protein n=1 Tax=Phlebia brevispora TaxID=194682 RepID=A0ACC1TFH8_9APHY|nr:hypothetical protein NM688_g21 [Phlebia brevispora]